MISNVVISQPNELIASITQNNTNLTVNSVGGTPNYVYEWIGPFGFSSSNQSIVPTTNAQYTVFVTDANGCVSEVDFNVNWISTSLESINILNFNIFPNPSDNDFNIEFNSLISQNLTLRVFNSVGDIIFIDNLESYIGEYKKQISLKEYSKAIYLLEIKTDDGIVNKKLILQ